MRGSRGESRGEWTTDRRGRNGRGSTTRMPSEPVLVYLCAGTDGDRDKRERRDDRSEGTRDRRVRQSVTVCRRQEDVCRRSSKRNE